MRVVSLRPILHSHVEGHEKAGMCSVGLVGKVTRVLEGRSYPKNMAVRFESMEGFPFSFEAHFLPSQLRKE
jgi:hypothetical protein